MGEWKQAGILHFPIKPDAIVALGQTVGTIQFIIRHGETLEGWSRGRKDPFPLKKQITIPGKFCGTGFIMEYVDGNYYIGWPVPTPEGQLGEVHTFWSRPSEWDDPSGDDDPVSKKLSVNGNEIFYGENPIKLCGASCRVALWKGNPDYPDYDPWPDGYSLDQYEADIIDSGINYVRHLGTMDFDFLYTHCQRMKEHDIIVEVEVYDPELSMSPVVEINRMGELALLGNVLFDVGNEFKSYEPAIDVVIDLCQRLKAQGCIVGAGAWSSPEGKGYSEIFHNSYDGHDYETHHRHWVPSHWESTMEYGKPVLFNEFFNLGNMTLSEIKSLMKHAFLVGCTGVQFYHFFGPPETQTFEEILDIAGELTGRVNT